MNTNTADCLYAVFFSPRRIKKCLLALSVHEVDQHLHDICK
ncbi:MAG: hypothetical protein KPEEDBHJ_00418 [Anaerolineales bacterium]|nr:hypothetical protein [Anaerolineales bacterium]